MEHEPVYCPGCGHEMEPEMYRNSCVMVCEKCGWVSPEKQGNTPAEAESAARAAAQVRSRPMQRPLTLEEVRAHIAKENCRPLYLEMKSKEADKFQEMAGLRWSARAHINHMLEYCTYGAKMRLWPDEPTEEERDAAEWEEASEKTE